MMHRFLLLLFLLPLLAFAQDVVQDVETIPDKTTLKILNPSLQDQQTLKMRLPNGLEAILVSDPHVKQSSVTMTVQAGAWQDPDAHPGLAHFLEHMLFMGTREYPAESEFERFISEHGGRTNAFTHGDFTSYIFSVQTSGLPEALKRFASFFKEPLFNPSGVERELHAIDQEFAQAFNNEIMRQYFVIKNLANPDHPVHRFQSGNSATLSKATTQTLKTWFDEHYSANLMHLYVLSSLPLSELKTQVASAFTAIPNKDRSPFQTSAAVFQKTLQGSLVRMASLKNDYTLSLFWEVPAHFSKMLDSHPEDVICYVLGHEGKESLLAFLKRSGLAFELSCGSFDISSSTHLLNLQIKLTKKGFEENNLVLMRVFQALKRLREESFPPSLFQEISQLYAQRYQFQEHDEPFDWATKQAGWLAQEPIETFPELSQIISKFDPQAISDLMKGITAEKAVIVLSAPKEAHTDTLDQKEPWMQIAYRIDPIEKEQLQKWTSIETDPAIHFPKPNPFIAYRLSSSESLYKRQDYPNIPSPAILLENAGIRFYYTKDPFYHVPRSFISFDIQSPVIKDGSPQSVVLTDLYVDALVDHLNEMIYDAKTADLNVSIERNLGAIRITLEGFSESLQKFFPPFIQQLLNLQLSEVRFAILREGLQKEYENVLREMPVLQTLDYFKAAAYRSYTTYAQKRSAIGKISFETFQNFASKLLKKTFIQGMFVSSLPKEEALELVKTLDRSLHPTASSYAAPYTPQTNSFPEKGPFSILSSTKAQGDALMLILEINGFSPTLRNTQQILSMALSPAFFSELRTKQQTGYIVLSNSLDLEKHLYNYFAAQSTSHTPQELLWRFEQFLEAYVQNLKTSEIPQERFELLKAALATAIQEPPPSLKSYGEQQFKLAFEIKDLDWMKKRLAELPSLTYEHFISFATDFLGRQNKRRLAIQLDGKIEDEQAALNYEPLRNIAAFRAVK
jgi:insulysin